MKVFVTLSHGETWACPRFSVVCGESAYMVKTFLHCGWAADIILEGTYTEDVCGRRTFEVEHILQGVDNLLLPFVTHYLRCS